MKVTSVSGRERPVPSAGFDAGEPRVLRLALTIAFEPQGGDSARVISCAVTRAEFESSAVEPAQTGSSNGWPQ
jgi:hypothetical protein